MTLQEAHKFCDAAEKLNQQTEKRDAVAASTNGPFAALPAPRIARASYASTRLVDLKKAEKARGLERAGRRLSTSIVRPAATNDERELNEVLRGLFAEADTDKKVGGAEVVCSLYAMNLFLLLLLSPSQGAGSR